MGMIHELLPKVSQEIGVIGKDHMNSQQNYRFRSVDDVLSHCGPVFSKHGITVSVAAREHKVAIGERDSKNGRQAVYHATLLLAVTFIAPDGSQVENVAAGEGIDYAGDKATAKATSAAFKYACFLSLCIPVDARSIEDSDREKRKRSPSQSGNGKPSGNAPDPFMGIQSAITRATGPKNLQTLREQAIKRFSGDEQKRLLELIDTKRQALETSAV